MAEKKKATKKNAKVKEVVSEQNGEQPEIRCGIAVTMTEAGDISFNISGSDQNLLLVEGLLRYANLHMEKIWEGRIKSDQE